MNTSNNRITPLLNTPNRASNSPPNPSAPPTSLNPPAIVTPADFNHFLARAKAQALAALLKIIEDPTTPAAERRKAASEITRATFLTLRQHTPDSPRGGRNRADDFDPEPVPLWGPSDVMLTSSSAEQEDQLLQEMDRRAAHYTAQRQQQHSKPQPPQSTTPPTPPVSPLSPAPPLPKSCSCSRSCSCSSPQPSSSPDSSSSSSPCLRASVSPCRTPPPL